MVATTTLQRTIFGGDSVNGLVDLLSHAFLQRRLLGRELSSAGVESFEGCGHYVCIHDEVSFQHDRVIKKIQNGSPLQCPM